MSRAKKYRHDFAKLSTIAENPEDEIKVKRTENSLDLRKANKVTPNATVEFSKN